jgi:hypothetical protein
MDRIFRQRTNIENMKYLREQAQRMQIYQICVCTCKSLPVQSIRTTILPHYHECSDNSLLKCADENIIDIK